MSTTDTKERFYTVLRKLLKQGRTTISASTLADEMWPDTRRHNTRGQTFNLAAGVAGRLLVRYRGCKETEPGSRCWEIIPEFVEAPGG